MLFVFFSPFLSQAKKTGPSAEEDEERQLQEMRAAGFMGTPARGGAASAAATPSRGGGGAGGEGAEAKPGERRIRREVWVKQADGSFEVRRGGGDCGVFAGISAELCLVAEYEGFLGQGILRVGNEAGRRAASRCPPPEQHSLPF